MAQAKRASPPAKETLNKYGTHSSRASSLPQNQAMVGASLLATILVQTFPNLLFTIPDSRFPIPDSLFPIPGYFAFIRARVMSSMRLEKPHSLSYQLSTLTRVPPMTRVWVAS
jgi:hypothetical protein